MFGDEVGAEKAAQNDEGTRGAVVPDVLDPEGAVEDASVDVRDLEGGAGGEAFACESGGDQAVDPPSGGIGEVRRTAGG